LIWILDDSGELLLSLKETLGSRYQFKNYTYAKRLISSLRDSTLRHRPSLLVFESLLNGTPVTSFLPGLIADKSLSLPPILVISKYNDIRLISECLNSGAHDYILRPADPNLLVAKVNTLIKTSRKEQIQVNANIEFDVLTLTASTAPGTSVKLTLKEFQILLRLAKAFPDGLTPTEIRTAVWGNLNVVSKALDVHLFKLRRKIALLNVTIQYGKDNRYSLMKV
jgi:two-component system response regulator ParR